MFIRVPITTEVIEKNADLQPNGKFEDHKIVIEFDPRKRDYHKLFNLKRSVKISWINECAFDAQELSGFSWPIVSRITTATGSYANQAGERVYFTPQIERLSTHRHLSHLLLPLRALLLLFVGLRCSQTR